MHFHLEHMIEAPPSAVEAALLDPATLQTLARNSPIRYRPELITRREHEDVVERVARVEARDLRAVAGTPIAPDRTSFTELMVWHRAAHAASFLIRPLLAPLLGSRVECRGEYQLRPEGQQATRRVIEGDVRVDVPVVGPGLEAVIVRLLNLHFASEARTLATLAAGAA